MAWYFRKSVKVGPVRFNLSKNGIGTSVGVRGFRVGVRANGKSYIHAGACGVYYRQELGNLGSSSSPQRSQPQLQPPTPDSTYTPPLRANTIEYTTASSHELAPQSRRELLDRLNQSYTSVRLDYVCGGIGALPSFAALQSGSVSGWVVVLLAVAAFIFTARWESKRRTAVLDYDLEDQGKRFQNIIGSFNSLAGSSKVWSMLTSTGVNGIHEWKRNAGASSLVSRSETQVGEGKPPWVETNVDVPVIKTRGQSLYMMPDGILGTTVKVLGSLNTTICAWMPALLVS